ncbi:hypothetical protein KM176_19500 [Pseudooceanicola sp. CBS1P-1]|uniref:Uncharacterized protein n=1 Tax=Pseudooceanicola albus TaxID=2692189 RepID=A0A6L7G759_9RHOB|nr:MULTISPECIES: hypothetical protein [Pseudooceanicola]MBT9386067.1 hypothetical protein [Pseudooceanicola endophyticus]MXN19512.1 hypothetical protein [Pseudooceanicola albus]
MMKQTWPIGARVLMTNSGTYAPKALGLTDRAVRFGSLAHCAVTACRGPAPATLPRWIDTGAALA